MQKNHAEIVAALADTSATQGVGHATGKTFSTPQKTAREVFSGILNVEKVVIR
ncbi:MAG: hypothetical protein ACK5UC_22850 [Planctomycetaceae bacterium]